MDKERGHFLFHDTASWAGFSSGPPVHSPVRLVLYSRRLGLPEILRAQQQPAGRRRRHRNTCLPSLATPSAAVPRRHPRARTCPLPKPAEPISPPLPKPGHLHDTGQPPQAGEGPTPTVRYISLPCAPARRIHLLASLGRRQPLPASAWQPSGC